eukprot:6475988-Amphidinium_carterae.1
MVKTASPKKCDSVIQLDAIQLHGEAMFVAILGSKVPSLNADGVELCIQQMPFERTILCLLRGRAHSRHAL